MAEPATPGINKKRAFKAALFLISISRCPKPAGCQLRPGAAGWFLKIVVGSECVAPRFLLFVAYPGFHLVAWADLHFPASRWLHADPAADFPVCFYLP